MRTVPTILEAVRASPSFCAFSAIVGLRVRDGNSTGAYRMLVAVGAPPARAHAVIEGWPLEACGHLEAAGVTLAEEAACRLACFVGRLDRHDWSERLGVAVRAAEDGLEAGE